MLIKKLIKQEELIKAFAIREEVFVNEQGCPLEDEYEQFDNLDGMCKHLLVHYHGQAVGTGRVRFMQDVGKLERICILEPYRKFGVGKAIVNKLEEVAVEQEAAQVKIHGQTNAEGFYHKLGIGPHLPRL